MSPQAQRILAALEELRRKLLDLTLRNRLLNYRPSKVRGINIAGEEGSQVYRMLVTDSRSMGFIGIPDRKNAESASDGIPALPVVDTSDDKLNTLYEMSALQDRLLRTWSDARTVIEEQGINTLFLTIGMLEWIEATDSAKALKAPLVLIPVSLERGERGRFRLRWSGEEVGGNLSLAVKVKGEYGLDWPEVIDGEEFDLGRYLGAVERSIAGQHG
jgi:hypothetical protein